MTHPSRRQPSDERPQAVIVRVENVQYHVQTHGMLNTPPWLDRTYGNRSHRNIIGLHANPTKEIDGLPANYALTAAEIGPTHEAHGRTANTWWLPNPAANRRNYGK